MQNKRLRKAAQKALAVALSLFWVIDSLHLENDFLACADLIPVQHSSFDKLTHLMLKGMRMGKTYQGSSAKVCVLIQDIHCQPEAQEKIAAAIQQLYESGLTPEILLEGAAGPVRTLLYETFPDRNVRMQAARRFLRRGVLTGAEFSVIAMGLGAEISLYGVEDPDLYIENFKIFHASRESFQNLKGQVKAIDTWLEKLKNKKYSQDLKRLNHLQESLNGETPHLDEWAKDLRLILKSHPDLFEKNKDLKIFLEWVEGVQKLNPTAVQGELDQLLKELQRHLDKGEFKAIVKATLEYRLGHLKVSLYLSELKKSFEGNAQSLSFETEYPNLAAWLSVNQKEKTLNVESFSKDLWALVGRVFNDQAIQEKVEDIAAFDLQWKSFKKLIRLELARSDLDKNVLHASLDVKETFTLLKNLAEKYQMGEPLIDSSQIQAFKELQSQAQKFYELALKRDEVMAIKAVNRVLGIGNRGLKEIIGRNSELSTIHYPRITVLMTGGFHTEGIQKILEKENISYVTWTPLIQGDLNSDLYERVMQKQASVFDYVDSHEFSSDRFLLRTDADVIKKMLSPVNAMEREIHEQLGLEKSQVLGPLLRELIDDLSQTSQKTVHQIVNRWFKKHADALRGLDEKEGRILVKAISKHKNCTLRWDRFNPNMKTAGRLIVAAMAKRWGEDSGVVKFARWYFRQPSTSKTESKNRAVRIFLKIFRSVTAIVHWLSVNMVFPLIVFLCLVGANYSLGAALLLVLGGMAVKIVLTPVYNKLPEKIRLSIRFVINFYFIFTFASLLSVYLGLSFLAPFSVLLLAGYAPEIASLMKRFVDRIKNKRRKKESIQVPTRQESVTRASSEVEMTETVTEEPIHAPGSIERIASLKAVGRKREGSALHLGRNGGYPPAMALSDSLRKDGLGIFVGEKVWMIDGNLAGKSLKIVRAKRYRKLSSSILSLQGAQENDHCDVSLDESLMKFVFIKDAQKGLDVRGINYEMEIIKALTVLEFLKEEVRDTSGRQREELLAKIQSLEKYLRSLRIVYFILENQITLNGIVRIGLVITGTFPGLEFRFIPEGVDPLAVAGRKSDLMAEAFAGLRQLGLVCDGSEAEAFRRAGILPVDIQNLFQLGFAPVRGLTSDDILGREEMLVDFLAMTLDLGKEEGGLSPKEREILREIEERRLALDIRRWMAVSPESSHSLIAEVSVEGYEVSIVNGDGVEETKSLMDLAENAVSVYPSLSGKAKEMALKFLVSFWKYKLRDFPEDSRRMHEAYQGSRMIQSLLPTPDLAVMRAKSLRWRFERDIEDLKAELQEILGPESLDEFLKEKERLEKALADVEQELSEWPKSKADILRKYEGLLERESQEEAKTWSGLKKDLHKAKKRNVLEKMRRLDLEKDKLQSQRSEIQQALRDFTKNAKRVDQKHEAIRKLEALKDKAEEDRLAQLEEKILDVIHGVETPQQAKSPSVEEKKLREPANKSLFTYLREKPIFRWIVLFVAFCNVEMSWGSYAPEDPRTTVGISAETVAPVIHRVETGVREAQEKAGQAYQEIQGVPQAILFWTPYLLRGYRQLEASGRFRGLFRNIEWNAYTLYDTYSLLGDRLRPSTEAHPDSDFENGALRERGILASLERGGGFYASRIYSRLENDGTLIADPPDFSDAPLGVNTGQHNTVTMYPQGREALLFRTTHSRIVPESVRIDGHSGGFELHQDNYGDVTLRITGSGPTPQGRSYRTVVYQIEEHEGAAFTPNPQFIEHYTELPQDEIPPPALRARLEALRSLDFEHQMAGIRQIIHDRFQYGTNEAAARMFGTPPQHWLAHGFEEASVQRGEILTANCGVLATYGFIMVRYLGIPARVVRGAVDGNSNRRLDISELHAIFQAMNPNGGNGWVDYDATTFVENGDSRWQGFQENVNQQERARQREEARQRGDSSETQQIAPEPQRIPTASSDSSQVVRYIYLLQAYCSRTDIPLSEKLQVFSRAIGIYEPEAVVIDHRILLDMESSAQLLMNITLNAAAEERQQLNELHARLAVMWIQKLVDHCVISVGDGNAFQRHLIQERRRWGLQDEPNTPQIQNMDFAELTQGMTEEQRDEFLRKLEQYDTSLAAEAREAQAQGHGQETFLAAPGDLTLDSFATASYPLNARDYFGDLFQPASPTLMGEQAFQQYLGRTARLVSMIRSRFPALFQQMLAYPAYTQTNHPFLLGLFPDSVQAGWCRFFGIRVYPGPDPGVILRARDQFNLLFDAYFFDNREFALHHFPRAQVDFFEQQAAPFARRAPIRLPATPSWVDPLAAGLDYPARLRLARDLQTLERTRRRLMAETSPPQNPPLTQNYFETRYAPIAFEFMANDDPMDPQMRARRLRMDQGLTRLMRRNPGLMQRFVIPSAIRFSINDSVLEYFDFRFHISRPYLLTHIFVRQPQLSNEWFSIFPDSVRGNETDGLFEADLSSFLSKGEIADAQEIDRVTFPGTGTRLDAQTHSARQRFFEQHVRPLMEVPPIPVPLDEGVEISDEGIIERHPITDSERQTLTADLFSLPPMHALQDLERRPLFLANVRRLFLEMTSGPDADRGFGNQIGYMESMLIRLRPGSDELRSVADYLLGVIREERRRLGNNDWPRMIHFYQFFYGSIGAHFTFERVILPEISKMLVQDILAFDPEFRGIDQGLQHGHQDISELKLLLQVYGVYYSEPIDDVNILEVSERFLEYLQRHPNQTLSGRLWQEYLAGMPGISPDQVVGQASISRETSTEIRRQFSTTNQGLTNIERFSVETVRRSGDLDRVRALLGRYRNRYRQELSRPERRSQDIPFSAVRMDEEYFRAGAGHLKDLIRELTPVERETITMELLREAETAFQRGFHKTEERIFYTTLLGAMMGIDIDPQLKEQIGNFLTSVFPSLPLSMQLEIFKAVQEGGSPQLKGFMINRILAILETYTPDQIRHVLEQAGLLDFFSVNVILHWQDFRETRIHFLKKMIPIALDVIPIFGLDPRARAGSTAELNYHIRQRQFDSFLGTMQTNWAEIVMGLVGMVESGIDFASDAGNTQGASPLLTPEIVLSRINLETLLPEQSPSLEVTNPVDPSSCHRAIERVYEAILRSVGRVIERERILLASRPELSTQDRQRIQGETTRKINALLRPMKGFFAYSSFPSTFGSPSDREGAPPVMYYERMESRIRSQSRLRPSEILRLLLLASDITNARWYAFEVAMRDEGVRDHRPYEPLFQPRLDYVDHYLMGFWLANLPMERRNQIEDLRRQGRIAIADDTGSDYVQLAGDRVLIRRDFLMELVALRDANQDFRNWTAQLYELVVSELHLPTNNPLAGAGVGGGQSGSAYALSLRNRDAGTQTVDAGVGTPGVYVATDPNFHFPLLRHDGNPYPIQNVPQGLPIPITPSRDAGPSSGREYPAYQSPRSATINAPRTISRMILPPALSIFVGLMAQTSPEPDTQFKHFSIAQGRLGEAAVPDNRRVGQTLKRELDTAQLSFTETRLTGDVLSFKAAEAHNHQNIDLLKSLSVFLNGSTLDEKSRKLFESTRLVVLGGDDAAVERDEKGIIYAHYGEGEGNAPATIYIRKKLLELLLQGKNRDALTVLIQMEMYRRENHSEDVLTTAQVAEKLNIAPKKIDRLISVVAEAETSRIFGEGEIESEIMSMASDVDQTAGSENSILGVKLLKLDDWVFERFVKRLTMQLQEREKAVIEALRRLREQARAKQGQFSKAEAVFDFSA